MVKKTLGIYIDGTSIKAALVSKDKKNLQIEMLSNFQLFSPLDQIYEEIQPEGQLEQKGAENPFETDQASTQKFADESGLAESKTNIDVVLSLVNLMCTKGTSVAFNLLDTNVVTKEIPSIPQTKPKQIKKAIRAELFGLGQEEVETENIDYLLRQDRSVLTIVHEDPLLLHELFAETANLVRQRAPRIDLIDAIEFAVANDITQTYADRDIGHTCIIIFSENYIKTFFLRNGEIETIFPTLHEGINSDTACDSLYSKLIFEIDSGKIGAVDTLFLLGEVERHNAIRFFEEKFSNVNIIRYEPNRATLGPQAEVFEGKTTSYAVPIALACKVLEDTKNPLYQQNYLPRKIKDKQAVYKIEWHGLIFLVLLFVFSMFLTYKSATTSSQIHDEQIHSEYLDNRLSFLTEIKQQVDSLNGEIIKLEEGAALIDSLSGINFRWSPYLEILSDAYESFGPFSLQSIQTMANNTLVINLEVLKREQVVEFERFIENSIINRVVKEQETDRHYKVQLQCQLKPGPSKSL